jgi:hypothetical protein
MKLVEKAFKGLFPDKGLYYTGVIIYSGHFKGYNANVRLNRFTKTMTFNLSKKWRGVNEDIKIGILQEMLLRLFKKKGRTNNIDLYHNFIKNVHIAVPKTRSHPLLAQSFNRVNRLFFAGMIDVPNLVLGRDSTRTLGHYDYGTDTITISSVLVDQIDLLDYVMYHEILHKKNKFKSKNGRTFHHTRQFREQERSYPNADELEGKLQRIVRKKKSLFKYFF